MSSDANPTNRGVRSKPTIGESFNTGERGERIFRDWLPDGCIPRKQEPDVFIDYVVEVVEKGEPTGRHFAAQIKSVKVGRNSATPLKFSAKGKHIRYWLEKCLHPVFVFLIDVEKRAGHWVFIQKWVRENVSKTALENQKSIKLRFNAEDNLNNRERFFSLLRDAEQYARNLHPGSVSAALEKARYELEQKEPRLGFHITATEQGQTIRLTAKDSFAFKIIIENDQASAAYHAFKKAVEDGEQFKFPLNHIKFSGSRLFEELGGKGGELTLDLGPDIPGSIIFQVPVPTGVQSLSIIGTYRFGTKTATFSGELHGAPLFATCVCDLCSDPRQIMTNLELRYLFRRWQGQPVLHLPYFELLLAAARELSNGGLQTEWFIQGNLFARGRLGGAANAETERLLETFSWIGRCRTVAAGYRINPRLPQFETITSEQLEIVNDLGRVFKMLFEPVQDGGQVNKTQEIQVAFLVTRADAAIALGPLKKVFDFVPLPIVTAMPSGRMSPSCPRRNAYTQTVMSQLCSKCIAVVPFVRHGNRAAQLRRPGAFGGDAYIGSLSSRQAHLHRPSASIHPSRELGIESTLGASDGLILLATRGVAGVLMHFDVAGVQETQQALGLSCQPFQNPRPQTALTPSTPARVNRTPRTIKRRQIAPGNAGAQHVHHCFDHQPMIFGRTAALWSGRQRYRNSRSSDDFFYPLPERIRQMKPRGFFHGENCSH